MPDLLAGSAAQRLPLPDADLLLWQQADLGLAYDRLLQQLIEETDWRQERITVYGKPYLQPRLSSWYGDFAYSYSGIRLEPSPWTPTLQQIRKRVEALTRLRFNSVLLNYYRDEHDGMGMHSDDEPELGPRPAIASISLGEERDFILRHRQRKHPGTVKLPLPSGSLLLMQGDTQRYWRHGINKLRRRCGPRVNLTFRRIIAGTPREVRV
ncbi:MAG: alpha-ketoglutarate-dependent dioxygenase AlkB [Gammaproteobacteria bacterium]|nr:alpha-ketoglutarate-dependent dioxygenase AlkB [Gammaproteobacteria bacterium]MDH3448566.1 alpha-ketoglutarate-dependent dioxygenase AlkB [Gammaproteobacteria bacterium]